MNNVLRVLNAVAIAILLAISFKSSLADEQGAAFIVGWWLGLALCLLAPALALFALRTDASPRLRRNAATASIIQIVGFIALGILPRIHQPLAVATTIGVLIFCIPFALNIWRLRSMNRSEYEDGHAPADSSWYPIRHWRGALPLSVAYWVNGALTAVVLFGLFGTFGAFVDRMPLRLAARGTLTVFAITLAGVAWLAVGVWRSATRHAERASALWPVLAKVTVIAATLGFGFLMATFALPQLRENALIALGRDPLETIGARVTTNQTVLLLHGTFGEGSAEKVRRLLAATPTIKTIALASNGGRLREASEIAQLARARRLDTYVDTRCESACTFVFLAGRDRAATPNARIGFHRPSFAGVNQLAQSLATERMLKTYRDAGIPKEFLDRVSETDSASMWYPSPAELEKAGVINRVSLGGETAALAALSLNTKKDLAKALRDLPMMVALDRHFPGTLDAAVQAAWNEHTQGGIDADVGTAARLVISDRYPRILAAADDEGLDVFARLMLDEMKAARAISTEACQLLLQGRLNIAQTLSPDLARREVAWALGILEAEKLETRVPVDPAEFQRAIAGATATMPPEMLDVASDPENYVDQPAAQCTATIELYDRILQLPEAERRLVLRGMFQDEAA
jgi:hypothetical protein